jgi:tetratricopeptide (TPR) repeat protein
LRLLGLHLGPDLDPYAAAALADTTIDRARHRLDLLARANLIQAAGPGRFGMHDLLRAYAAELATAQDGAQERQAALTRLFDHYLHAAAAAMDTLYPATRHRSADLRPPATPIPPVTDPAMARAWLDGQRAALVAVAAYTADHGWPGHTTRLATIIFRYLEGGGHYPETVAIYGHARRAACRTGDRAAEAEAHNNACVVDLRQGRYQQAASHLHQALALYRQVGDHIGEAYALGNLGIVDFQEGRYRQASSHHRQALALYRQAGIQGGEARTLGNLGLVDLRQGRYRQASGHFLRSLALCRQIGDATSQARALGNLGTAELRQGRCQQASDHLRQALALFRQTGDQPGEAEALNGLGEVLLAAGEPGQARQQLSAALALASQIGDKYEKARAHNGIACACRAVGEPDQARNHWQQALTLYAGLGAPEADQVRARLTAGGSQGQRQL